MALTNPNLSGIVQSLRASGFRELAGARLTATFPLSERLLNDVIAASLPPSGAVREATVHPQPQDRLGVRVKLARPEFLPPVSATLVIERQPDLPHNPFLVFRVTGFAGLLALAGPLVSLRSMLPPGVRLDSDLLTVDLGTLLAQHGQREWLALLETLRVSSEAGRLVVNVEARIP